MTYPKLSPKKSAAKIASRAESGRRKRRVFNTGTRPPVLFALVCAAAAVVAGLARALPLTVVLVFVAPRDLHRHVRESGLDHKAPALG